MANKPVPHGPPPSPVKIRAEIEHMRDRLLDSVMDEYRWAYNLGHDQKQRGDVKTRSTSHADPTQSIVLGQRSVRLATRIAAEKIFKARSMLMEAQRHLERAHAINDADHIMEDLDPPRNSFGENKHQITKREEREVRAAQERRRRRDEGWGVA